MLDFVDVHRYEDALRRAKTALDAARSHTTKENDEENENPVQQAAKRRSRLRGMWKWTGLFEHRRTRCCERRWPRALEGQKLKP